MERPEVTIIIPAYNEEETIFDVVRKVKSFGLPIVIDDASKDKTAALARDAGAIVVLHLENKGYDGALNSGFLKADELGCTYAITFDADGQHDAEILGIFLRHLRDDEFDLVLGVRPKKARISEILIGWYFRLRFGIKDILCGMKGYKMSLYRENGGFDHINSIGSELAMVSIKTKCAFIQVPVPIHHRTGNPRFGTLLKSNIRIMKALLRVIIMDAGWKIPVKV
jgi:glycosyltransferase involved in cell wall biosynthesis